MFGITYQLKLIQPLIVAMLDPGDENAARSLNYVPGSVMRGALAMRYIASQKLPNDRAAQDAQCRALFFEDETLFLDCVPVDDMGKRAKPIPLSWFAGKKDVAEWNSASEDRNAKRLTLAVVDAAPVDDELTRMDNPKPINGQAQFCRVDDEGEAILFSPRRETATHISRPRTRITQNPKADRAVFTYEALAADQLLAGVVLCRTLDGAEKARKILLDTPDVLIGRSRSAGYGHVRIQNVSSPIASWQETEGQTDEIEPIVTEDEVGNETGWYVITLQSHAILRDADGQFTTDPCQEIGASAKAARCFLQMENLGGYNRKWRLPTPQAQAVRAGSVFVYHAKDINPEALRHALKNGIGERRNDGLGQIAVSRADDSVTCVRRTKSMQPPADKTDPQEQGEIDAIEKIIIEAVLRRKLDQRVAYHARELASHLRHSPSNAMLSRLMMAARQSALTRNAQPLARFLLDVRGESLENLKTLEQMQSALQTPQKDGASRKPAQAALENARLVADTFAKWLQDRVVLQDVERQLKIEVSDLERQLGGRKTELSAELRQEYTARLIERVAKQAIKAGLKKKEQAQ